MAHVKATAGQPRPPGLHAEQLSCSRGERTLFSRLDLSVPPGTALQVAGPNGAGKTSLLRLLCGLSVPECGAVYWQGRALGRARSECQVELAYVGHAPALKADLAAWENLVFHAALRGRQLDRRSACAWLERLGLRTEAGLPARLLSEGQRKRVALAGLQLGPPGGLWILDEPFSALDGPSVAALGQAIAGHLAAGGVLVYTTHLEIGLRGARLELGAGRERAC